jgi:hypothetical protein
MKIPGIELISKKHRKEKRERNRRIDDLSHIEERNIYMCDVGKYQNERKGKIHITYNDGR